MIWKHISEVGEEAIDYIEKRRTGEISSLKTKWPKFNYATMDGLEWNSIITIAGSSGVGKTLLINELESSLFEQNPNQDFIVISNNYEMLSRNLIIRKLSAKFKLTHKSILSAGQPVSPGQVDLMKEYIRDTLSRYSIYYVDIPQSVSEMEALIHEFYATHGKPIVFTIDHSLLVKKSRSESSALEMLYNLGDMQSKVKKLVPIIFVNLSQLNREIEGEGRRKPGTIMNYPVKSDISSADALYHHSEIVLVLNRPSMFYLPVYGPEREKVYPNDIYWHILKNRNGEPCIIRMEADFKNMTINEL